jgi:hypothetical protein
MRTRPRQANKAKQRAFEGSPCIDCGRKTFPGGRCVGCLEKRLGRVLTPNDFTDAPINQADRRNSLRLNARLTGLTDR